MINTPYREAYDDVIVLAEKHKGTWRDRPSWYWYFGLIEEVIELGLSLLGLHKHAPELELKQISAIAANWLSLRYDKEN